MFTNILVPVDLSDRSRASVEVARKLAAPGALITVLHVVETLEDVSFEEMEDFYRQLEQRAVEVLDGWIEELERSGRRSERTVVFGHRLEEILHFASEQKSDLILLRSHRVEPPVGIPHDGGAEKAAEDVEPGSGRRGWATLSYRVAVLADCPVLLVK